jgi:hypothetical protein
VILQFSQCLLLTTDLNKPPIIRLTVALRTVTAKQSGLTADNTADRRLRRRSQTGHLRHGPVLNTTYHVSKSSRRSRGAMIDRGANGGIAGSDTRRIATLVTVDVVGIDDHDSPSLSFRQSSLPIWDPPSLS